MPTRAVGTRIFCPLFALPRGGFCPRLMQVFREAFLQKGRQPAPWRSSCRAGTSSATRAAAPSRPPCIHAPAVSMEPPGSAICLSPPAPETADLCTPAREGTPCAPSVPSRGIRRPARSGGGYRPGMGPVWRQHRRQFTQKGSIEPAAALAAVRCRPRRIYKVFRQAFLQKGRHPRRSALSASPRISALTNRRRCGRISLPADPECNTVRRRTQ